MSVSELAGRRILITGGASGMGEGLVRSLTGMGALVVSMDLNRERGEAVAKAAGARGFMEVDVADEGSVARAVDAACTRLGGLDVLIDHAPQRAWGLGTVICGDRQAQGLARHLTAKAVGFALA